MTEDYLLAKKIGGRYVGKAASPKTITAYRNAFRATERMLGMPVEAMVEADGDVLMQRMEDEGLENAYRANILAALRGFFSWAIATGRYRGSHPLAAISTPKAKRKLPTILTKEQLDTLFDAIRHRKYRLMFELMYYGGLRSDEVRSLTVEDVYDDSIRVRGKGDKDRYVYLPTKIVHALKDFVREHNCMQYVFAGQGGGKMHHARVNAVFAEARDKCGLPKALHPHNLRHTSATHFHAETGDLAMTQRWLGHARPETTMIYAQIADARMKNAAAKVFG